MTNRGRCPIQAIENKYNQSLVCHLLRLFRLAILSMQFVDNDNFL